MIDRGSGRDRSRFMTNHNSLNEETTAAMTRRSPAEIEANACMLQQKYAIKKYINHLAGGGDTVRARAPSPTEIIKHHLPISPEPTRSSSRAPPTEFTPSVNVISNVRIPEIITQGVHDPQSNRLLACVAPTKIYHDKQTQTDNVSDSESELIFTLRKRKISPKLLINLLATKENAENVSTAMSSPTSTASAIPAPDIDWTQILQCSKMNKNIINAIYSKSNKKYISEDKEKEKTEKLTATLDRENAAVILKTSVLSIMEELAVDGVIDFNSRKDNKNKRVAHDTTTQAAAVPNKEAKKSIRQARIPRHNMMMCTENQVPMLQQHLAQHESNYVIEQHHGYTPIYQHPPVPLQPPQPQMPYPRPPIPMTYRPVPPAQVQYSTIAPRVTPAQVQYPTIAPPVTPAHVRYPTIEPPPGQCHHEPEYHRIQEFDRVQRFQHALEYHRIKEYNKVQANSASSTGYPNSEWSDYARF